jgi:urease accessory protein UreF
MLGAVNAILQAAMRLMPFSHRDAQGALHRLRPAIASLSEDVIERPRLLAAFHPLQEIASMRHAAAEARLFMS